MATLSKTKKETSRRPRRWTARELLRLPLAEREPILAAAAEHEYRTNRELTAFEAFGPGDLYGDSANSKPK